MASNNGAKNASTPTNYAKRGWMWLGIAVLEYVIYQVLTNFISISPTLRKTFIAFGSLVILSIIISAIHFLLAGINKQKLYYLLFIIELLVLIILVFVLMFAFSY